MSPENPTNQLTCYCCKANYTENDSFCGSCGYPLKGTPEEQKQYSINYTLKRFDKEDTHANVAEARIVLFLLAIFTAIFGLITYFNDDSLLILIINLILAVIYAGLGFWASRRAFGAIFTGGLIYVSIILLNGIFEPITIFQGIIFKVIFIAAFVKAAYGAYKFKIDRV